MNRYHERLLAGAPATVSGTVEAVALTAEDFASLRLGHAMEVSCTVDHRWAAWWDGLFERGHVCTMTARVAEP